jgi:hypothetical protein
MDVHLVKLLAKLSRKTSQPAAAQAPAEPHRQDGEASPAQLGRELTALARADWSWDKGGGLKRAAVDILLLRARTGRDYADRSIYDVGQELGLSVPKSTAARQLAELVRRGRLERHEPEQRYDPSTGQRDAPSYRNLAEAIAVLLPAQPKGVGQALGTGPTSTNGGLVGQAAGRHKDGGPSDHHMVGHQGSGEPLVEAEREEGRTQQSTVPSARASRNGGHLPSRSGHASGASRPDDRATVADPSAPPHIAYWLGRADDGRDEERLELLTDLDARVWRQYRRAANNEEQHQALLRAGLLASTRRPRGRTA